MSIFDDLQAEQADLHAEQHGGSLVYRTAAGSDTNFEGPFVPGRQRVTVADDEVVEVQATAQVPTNKVAAPEPHDSVVRAGVVWTIVHVEGPIGAWSTVYLVKPERLQYMADDGFIAEPLDTREY